MAESTDESNQNITISDQASAEDSLGLKPYVIAMAEFLTHPDTKPPLTISIEGEWGSGKSSFMKQLEDQIKVKSEELKKEKLNKLKSRRSRWWYSLELKFGQKTQTVWFNAWRHDKAESLWATFAISFLGEISRNRDLTDFIPNVYSSFLLFRKRLDFKGKPIKAVQIIFSGLIISSIILVIIATIIDVTLLRKDFFLRVSSQYIQVLDIIAPPKEKQTTTTDIQNSDNRPKDKQPTKTDINNSDNLPKEKQPTTTDNKSKDSDNPFLSLSLLFGGAGGSWIGVGKLLSKLKELIGDPKMDLTKYLESPDYNKQVAFIEKFHADFRKIVEAYIGKDEKVYVFIDDLDRCELGKAADLLQALNMMISNDPQIIFILGMDREKVAAGITYKQKDVLPFLASTGGKNQDSKENENKENDHLSKQLDYGFSYLEKFVQLSFTLPTPSENSLYGFFAGLSTTDKENKNYEKRFFWTPIVLFIANKSHEIKIYIYQVIFYKLFINLIFINIKISPQLALILLNQYQNKHKNLKQEAKSKPPERAIFSIIKKHLDKDEKEDIVKMVAPFLDNNPRRLKQYLNALRLKRYMYYYAIGVKWNERVQITQQQLGKFVAITLKYPRILLELGNNDNLLYQLEDCAIDKFNQSKGFNDSQNTKPTDNNQKSPNYGDALYWVNTYPKIAKLLCYEEDENNNPKCRISILSLKNEYSLKNEGIKKLLEVSPQLELPDKYFKLREFLEAKKWREADDETLNVMLKVAKRENYGYLDIDDINEFPCDDLHIIDQLWVKYSEGRFGFSVQKEIYQELGGTKEYNSDIGRKFMVKVGWHNDNKLRRGRSKDVDWQDYDNDLPRGYFPWYEWQDDQWSRGAFKLASRLVNCNI